LGSGKSQFLARRLPHLGEGRGDPEVGGEGGGGNEEEQGNGGAVHGFTSGAVGQGELGRWV